MDECKIMCQKIQINSAHVTVVYYMFLAKCLYLIQFIDERRVLFAQERPSGDLRFFLQ